MWLKRHKTLALALSIFGTALVVIVLGAIPLWSSIQSLQAKERSKMKELESLQAKVNLISRLDQTVLDSRVEILDKALPPKKDILLYLSSIDGLSRELGLSFGGLSIIPGDLGEASVSAMTKTTPGLQTLESEIKIRGGKDSVYSFLSTIENILPLMQIKDIKVSATGLDQYSLSLTLAMLWAEPQNFDVKGQITLLGAEDEKYFETLSGYKQYESVFLSAGSGGIKGDLFAPFASEPIPQP